MVSNSERFVFVLQSYLRPSPKGAPYVNIRDLASLLINRVKSGKSHKYYADGTIVYRIRQAYIKDERYLVMLITRGDKNTANPNFEHLKTGALRPILKNEEEGESSAAHMVIDLKELKPEKPLNTVFLERVPGLSPSKIKMFLTHEIKQVFKETCTLNGKERNYSAILELDGHISHTLGGALKDGTLKNVSLIEHKKKQDGHDEHDYISEKNYRVDMKMKPDLTNDNAIKALKNIYEDWKTSDTNKYDKMVVRIKTPQGNTKETKVELNDNTEDFLATAFYHQEIINGFSPPLEASRTSIRNDVVVKMIGLAKN